MTEKARYEAALTHFEDTNWLEQYFWPFGRSSIAEFGRGWLLIVLLQTVMILIGLILLYNKMSTFGYALIISNLFVGSWAIGILHIRRLHDSGRAGWLAFFVFIPMIIAVTLFVLPQPHPGQWGRYGRAQVSAAAQKNDINHPDRQNQKIAKSKKSSNREALREVRQQQDGQRQRSRGRRRGSGIFGGPSGWKKVENKALRKGIRLVSGYGVFAFLLSLFSLLGIHRMTVQTATNEWGDQP